MVKEKRLSVYKPDSYITVAIVHFEQKKREENECFILRGNNHDFKRELFFPEAI